MANMIYADDLKQAMEDAGQFEYVKAKVVYKSAWGVPIVDAEEVVRCKDCKFYKEFDAACPYLQEDGYYMKLPGENDFCSRGVKKWQNEQ